MDDHNPRSRLTPTQGGSSSPIWLGPWASLKRGFGAEVRRVRDHSEPDVFFWPEHRKEEKVLERHAFEINPDSRRYGTQPAPPQREKRNAWSLTGHPLKKATKTEWASFRVHVCLLGFEPFHQRGRPSPNHRGLASSGGEKPQIPIGDAGYWREACSAP